jgi:KAP family P-loop domain
MDSIFIPEDLLDDDKLDRKILIEALGNAVYKKLNGDPIISGNIFLLDGSWGSGKSWCVEKLKQWYIKDNIDIVVSDYSAWQYFSEKELFFDFWEHLQPQTFTKENGKEIIEYTVSLIDGVNKVKITIGEFGEKAVSFTGKIMDTVETYSKFCGENEFLNFATEFASDHLPILKQFKQTASNISGLKERKDQLELLEKLVEATESSKIVNPFEKISTKTNPYKNINIKKTLIILEDLDRVSEDKLWRIFSLLSLFEKNENIVFLLVGSSKFLVEIIEKKYHVANEGENFLAKFIAVKFLLSKKSNYTVIKNIFQGIVPYFNIEREILDENFFNIFDKNSDAKNHISQEVIKLNLRFDNYSYRDFKINIIEYLEKLININDTNIILLKHNYSYKYTYFILYCLIVRMEYPSLWLNVQKIIKNDLSISNISENHVLQNNNGSYSWPLSNINKINNQLLITDELLSTNDNKKITISNEFGLCLVRLLNNTENQYFQLSKNYNTEEMPKTTISDIKSIIHAIESF